MEKTDPEFITTLKMAAGNIRRFHEQQLHKNFVVNDTPGIVLGQKYTPIQRAGVYVPGGTASIFAAIGVFASSFTFRRSLLPTISSIVRTPSFAIYSRSS